MPLFMFIKIFLVCCVGMGCNQSSHTNRIAQDTTYLYRHWIHSHEEDERDKHYVAYRPAGFKFPPARGREGFEIRKNGVFIWYPIAATDGNDRIEEKWSLKKNKLIIQGKEGARNYTIISITKDKLVLFPERSN